MSGRVTCRRGDRRWPPLRWSRGGPHRPRPAYRLSSGRCRQRSSSRSTNELRRRVDRLAVHRPRAARAVRLAQRRQAERGRASITRIPPRPGGTLLLAPRRRPAPDQRRQGRRPPAAGVRAWNRGSVARTAEANLGSSASDRSICSNSRCSCSESGTALLPGHQCRSSMERRTVAAGRLLTGKSTRGYAGRKAAQCSALGIFRDRVRDRPGPRTGHPGPLRLTDPGRTRGEQAGRSDACAPNRATAASAAAPPRPTPAPGARASCRGARSASISPSIRTPSSRIRSPGRNASYNARRSRRPHW